MKTVYAVGKLPATVKIAKYLERCLNLTRGEVPSREILKFHINNKFFKEKSEGQKYLSNRGYS